YHFWFTLSLFSIQNTLDQKIHTLVGNICSNNILNLTSPGLIPERFQAEIQKVKERLEIPLSLVANEQERQLLVRLTSTKSLEDIGSLVKSISLVPQTVSPHGKVK
ncbi:hypothetical protein INT47_010519, partial [Mucor saturninus]